MPVELEKEPVGIPANEMENYRLAQIIDVPEFCANTVGMIVMRRGNDLIEVGGDNAQRHMG